MYSPRPGTPGAELEGQVPAEVKSERLQRLQALITRQQRVFNAAFTGRTVEVLLEKPGRLPGQLVGKSPYLQAVQVMAARSAVGETLPVTITEVGSNSLFGALRESIPAPQLAAAGA
jgi:tRNA-2-methylthio-N6-dimethylallyladenosine synthase